jgi:hypothetical protein
MSGAARCPLEAPCPEIPSIPRAWKATHSAAGTCEPQRRSRRNMRPEPHSNMTTSSAPGPLTAPIRLKRLVCRLVAPRPRWMMFSGSQAAPVGIALCDLGRSSTSQKTNLRPRLCRPIQPLWRAANSLILAVERTEPSRSNTSKSMATGPKTESGRDYEVSHKRPIADGGQNTLENIEPIHPDDHRPMHVREGDAARWARRASTARAFGGRVEPPAPARMRVRGLGALGILSDITGIMSGRIRTDTPTHFWYDMAGFPAPDDYEPKPGEII